MNPFISICIPAYKRVSFLTRLLDSINVQTYKNIEVIITDDSTDESVAGLVKQYSEYFVIRYQKNLQALGSPANWNAAIRLAKGAWIKIMHDDDWFTDENSLAQFASAAGTTDLSFIFSGFHLVNMEDRQTKQYVLTGWHAYLLKRNPFNIIAQNFIGHPSTTLIKNDQTEWYDEHLKWLVDVEYYSRLITRHKQFYAIRQPLISVGVNNEQLTKIVFRNPEVEIPEHLYVLNKVGPSVLRSVIVYDHFWRFTRNLRIRDMKMIERYKVQNDVPEIMVTIVRHQSFIPSRLLFIGIVSKITMFASYLCCRFMNKLG